MSYLLHHALILGILLSRTFCFLIFGFRIFLMLKSFHPWLLQFEMKKWGVIRVSPGDVHTSSLEVQQSHVSSALWLVDIPTSTCETHVYQRLGYLIIKPIINLIWPRLLCISETLQSKKVALHLTSVAGVFIFLDKTFLYLPCTVEVGEVEQALLLPPTDDNIVDMLQLNSWHFTDQKSETCFYKISHPKKRNLEEVLFGRILACLHQLFRSKHSKYSQVRKQVFLCLSCSNASEDSSTKPAS